MKPFHHLIAAVCLLQAMIPAHADEREVTDDQKAAVANGGDAVAEVKRPENIPISPRGIP
jgi:hypothetical protein